MADGGGDKYGPPDPRESVTGMIGLPVMVLLTTSVVVRGILTAVGLDMSLTLTPATEYVDGVLAAHIEQAVISWSNVCGIRIV